MTNAAPFTVARSRKGPGPYRGLIACLILSLGLVPAAGGQVAPEPSAGTDLAYERGDLEFILDQIEIAEEHVRRGGGCETLRELIPSALLPWGLRHVDGSCNNLMPHGEQWGAADEPFPDLTSREYRRAHPMSFDPLAENDVVGAETSYARGDGRTVVDSHPRLISQLVANNSTRNPAAAAAAAAVADVGGEQIDADITGIPQFFIPNTAPDEGLSAPTNAFITFFGQFFDHGLDLIETGDNGIVVIPLAEDDPLYDPESATNFQILTRSTRDAGPDGMLGTPDDGPASLNKVTPHVDQNQNYSSHPAAQVLIRAYEFAACSGSTAPANPPAAGCLQPSGYMLNDWGDDRTLDTADDDGLPTWNAVRANARLKLGLELDDLDGANQPLILVNQYGAFIPGPARGLPQLVVGYDEAGAPQVLEGDLDSPVDASLAVRINHSLFLDVAHSANPGKFVPAGSTPALLPDADSELNPRTDMLSGQSTRGVREAAAPLNGQATYDDELLGMHFICGDGRCNENIALTSIHHIWHSEHNRLVDITKRALLDTGDLAFINQWISPAKPLSQSDLDRYAGFAFAINDASHVNQVRTYEEIDALGFEWNGERLWQTAKFGVEMQYNRIVFDEFSPTISALKNAFVFTNQTTIDPRIVSEFAHSVYRFGHSMLTERVDRFDPENNPIVDASAVDPARAADQFGLFEAFLNPTSFRNYDDDARMNTLSPRSAAGAVIRGVTRQVSSEIDEFMTGALQNNLAGLPIDLASLNIARGRETGLPSLNAARRMFYADRGDTALAPYVSWLDYADNMRNPESFVNFVAAYGTHPLVAGIDRVAGNNSLGEPSTLEERRSAACHLISAVTINPGFCEAAGFGAIVPERVPADAADFLRSRGAWVAGADGLPITGIEEVDFWIGGLAEERRPFQGYLGATHNYVFETQMENLQNGDRFYYLHRTAGMPMLASLESNPFSALVMRNTDLGDLGSGSLPAAVFSAPHHYLEVTGEADQLLADPEPEEAFFQLVIRDPALSTSNIPVAEGALFLQYTGGDHVVIGGSAGPDTLIGGIGDDSIWGRSGDDRIEGGDGADHIEGGSGNDIITDLSGPDVIEGGDGHDAINPGNGPEDFVFGDAGSDFLFNPYDFAELFGGPGNDFLYDGSEIGHHRGGAGDDWLENEGSGEEILAGDFGVAPEFGQAIEKGNDVVVNHDGNADIDLENGDDIALDGPGMDIMEGGFGFDWASFARDGYGIEVDLDLRVDVPPVFPPSRSNYQNRYNGVEGVSGSKFSDILRGTDNNVTNLGHELSIVWNAAGEIAENSFDLIEGLNSSESSFGLVPEVERRELDPDLVTGERQHGWEGEILLGGGSSDLLVGEGGHDILDGDSAIDIGISSPNPMGRMDGSGLAVHLAEQALAAAEVRLENLLAERAIVLERLAEAERHEAEVIALYGPNRDSDLAAVDAARIRVAETSAALQAAQAQLALVAAEYSTLSLAVDEAQAALDAGLANEALVSGQLEAANAAVIAAEARVLRIEALIEASESASSSLRLDTENKIRDLDRAYQLLLAALTDLSACQSDPARTDGCLAERTEYDYQFDRILRQQEDLLRLEANMSTAASTTNSLRDQLAAAEADWEQALREAAQLLIDSDSARNAVVQLTAALDAAKAELAAYAAVRDAAEQAVVDAQAAAASALAALDLAEKTNGEGLAALEAARIRREAAAARLAVLDSQIGLARADVDLAYVALEAARAGMPTSERVIVDSMRDVQEAVFMGAIRPDELSIHRAITDHDPVDAAVDVVRYRGNLADYTIESDPGPNGIPGDDDDPFDLRDPAAFIGDFYSRNGEDGSIHASPDGFIEIIDNRTNLVGGLYGPDGRDLVRNVERLIFDDAVIELKAGVAGAGSTVNSVVEGEVIVTPAFAQAGQSVWADLAVSDADGINLDTVSYRWTVEVDPGSGLFQPIIRLGTLRFGDVFMPNGAVLDLTLTEVGRRVRVEVIYQDGAGVFESVNSAAFLVNCPAGGCPAGLAVPVPANFLGGAADLAAALQAEALAVAPVPFAANASVLGSQQLDFRVTNLPLELFQNTGFGPVLTGAEGASVSDIALIFRDANGVQTGSFMPTVGPRINPQTGFVDQANVDLSWALSDLEVLQAVRAPFTTVSLTVGGVEAANATLFGDPNLDWGMGLVVALENQSPPLDTQEILAEFVGFDSVFGDSPSFVNHSLEGGAFFAQLVFPQVDLASFQVDFGGEVLSDSSALVTSGVSLRIVEVMPFAPLTEARTTGIYIPRLRSRVSADGVSQTEVDVVFELTDSDASGLINGLAYAVLESPGLGVGEVNRWTLFGDSLGAPEEVVVLGDPAQLAAAITLVQAQISGDPTAIAIATDAMSQAIQAAAILRTQNVPGGPASILSASGLPHANFMGTAESLPAIQFLNDSRVGEARFQFSMEGVPLDLFANHGFSTPVALTDAILVDRLSLYFFTEMGSAVGVFVPQITAEFDAGTGFASQGTVTVDWSMRGDRVLPLVSGVRIVTVALDGEAIQTIVLHGNSMFNDAQDVVQLPAELLTVNSDPALLDVTSILANTLIGNSAGAAEASTTLDEAIAAELDADGDGIFGVLDVCPFDPQNDADQDGVCGDVDNCPATYNPDQLDSDSDGLGDACDNCRFVENGPMSNKDLGGVIQRDSDGDGHGNLCDADFNNDGVVNFGDLASLQASFFSSEAASMDMNGDGVCNFAELSLFNMYMFGTPGELPPAQAAGQ